MNTYLKPSNCSVLFFCLVLAVPSFAQVTFTGSELLGRPTDHSITLNMIADAGIDAYVEYGTAFGVYEQKTDTQSRTANEPLEILIDHLTPDTRYFYRVRYRESNTSNVFSARTVSTFHTQRSPNDTFVFTIIADSHLGGGVRLSGDRFRRFGFNNPDLYMVACQNVNRDNPDLHFDLGDTFSLTGGEIGDIAYVHHKYMDQRSYMGLLSHSTPVFLAIGNHEEEEGWNLDDAGIDYAKSLPVMGANERKRTFLNPIPDDFYTGNKDRSTVEIDGDRLKEDYYAFEWGCALFVVLDPYWYTTVKPFTGRLGGENLDDDVPPPDRWRWTLGKDQYDWLKQTLA